MFKAIVFDFDGVITDTEPVHMQAWLQVFAPLGISFEKEEYDRYYLGFNDRDFLDAVGRTHNRAFMSDEKAKLIPIKLKQSLKLLNKEIPLMKGVQEFVERSSKNTLLAICSGANKEEVYFVLRQLGWYEFFDPIVTQEDVIRGKPDPEGYKLAWTKLRERIGGDLKPSDCLAIEDSPKGIAAARAAGMKCLAISNSYPATTLQQADWVVKSISDFKL